jgi:hypothetical protein
MVYLQITLKIDNTNRPAAAGVYQRYKAPFLSTIAGAKSKELLVRDSNGELVRATSNDVGGIVDRRVFWMKGYGYAASMLSARLEDGSGAYPIATTR